METWGKRGDMVVHEQDPYNAEPPRGALADDALTAADTFYVRNHGPVPDIDPAEWRLRVDGLVARPMELSLDDLKAGFARREVTATLQCAGNRRAGFNEVREVPGEDPWGPGATSTARWTGVALADVLAEAGLQPDAAHVALGAPDVSPLADPPQPYAGSVPTAKATAGDVLLVWDMNGAPLPRVHGGPLRAVVPGWIGARSVKWLHSITAQAEPSNAWFQATAYRILRPDADPATAGPGDGIPLGAVALNCDFLRPDDGARLPAGPTRLVGYAFAGQDRQVARVDVSADGGRTWTEADLGPSRGRWTWQHWQLTADLPRGENELLARAWDSTGALQPESPEHLWNPKGYANNSWARLRVTCT